MVNQDFHFVSKRYKSQILQKFIKIPHLGYFFSDTGTVAQYEGAFIVKLSPYLGKLNESHIFIHQNESLQSIISLNLTILRLGKKNWEVNYRIPKI